MKLSQDALGKVLGGFTKSSVSRWELEKMPPDAEARRRLVDWIGFDPEVLST